MKDFSQRFWAKVNKSTPDACWEWTAATNPKGYGLFNIAGKLYAASRVAFYCTHGYWPPVVMHSCDNPPCCNPKHLVAGTNAKNSADMKAKGRSTQGERHGHAKLTLAQVRRIPSLRKRYTQREIAEMFDVTRATISDAEHKRTWAHA